MIDILLTKENIIINRNNDTFKFENKTSIYNVVTLSTFC